MMKKSYALLVILLIGVMFFGCREKANYSEKYYETMLQYNEELEDGLLSNGPSILSLLNFKESYDHIKFLSDIESLIKTLDETLIALTDLSITSENKTLLKLQSKLEEALSEN